MKKYPLPQRLKYWFDTRMSKGTIALVRLLAIVTAVFCLLISAAVILLTSEEGGAFSTIWDTFYYTINAWVPASDEGSPLYLAFMVLSAIVGLLITSTLIGILTTGMEEKVEQLRKGTSLVLETGHIVILGFGSGICPLIHELCQAAPGEKRCIVVADSMDKTEMEDYVEENLDIPKSVSVIFRSVDISNPNALACCSIPFAKSVIINQREDGDVIKALLAVNRVLSESDSAVPVIACIQHRRHLAAAQEAGGAHATILPVGSLIARLIAHTCTQPGLALAFNELIQTSGSEFYFVDVPELVGCSFGDIALRMEHSTPVGIEKQGETMINPSADTMLEAGDKLIVLSDAKDPGRIAETTFAPEGALPILKNDRRSGSVLILGSNSMSVKLSGELRDMGNSPILASSLDEIVEGAANQEDMDRSLYAALQDVRHVILLSEDAETTDEAETSDRNTMFALLQLREARRRLGLSFNITAELKQDKNKALLESGEYADFVVATDITAMLLAQLSEQPELLQVYKELLSSAGNELYIIPAGVLVSEGESITNGALRAGISAAQAIYLGYITQSGAGLSVTLNPELNEVAPVSAKDGLLILAQDQEAFVG